MSKEKNAAIKFTEVVEATFCFNCVDSHCSFMSTKIYKSQSTPKINC